MITVLICLTDCNLSSYHMIIIIHVFIFEADNFLVGSVPLELQNHESLESFTISKCVVIQIITVCVQKIVCTETYFSFIHCCYDNAGNR